MEVSYIIAILVFYSCRLPAVQAADASDCKGMCVANLFYFPTSMSAPITTALIFHLPLETFCEIWEEEKCVLNSHSFTHAVSGLPAPILVPHGLLLQFLYSYIPENHSACFAAMGCFPLRTMPPPCLLLMNLWMSKKLQIVKWQNWRLLLSIHKIACWKDVCVCIWISWEMNKYKIMFVLELTLCIPKYFM